MALPLQLTELTGSTLAVGALGAVELVPLLVFGLYGGALADFVDHRRLIVGSELALGVISALLLLNSLLPHPQVWPLYAAAALSSALTGLQRPAAGGRAGVGVGGRAAVRRGGRAAGAGAAEAEGVRLPDG
ncbi:MFS family permease [Streptomyces auratus]